MPSTSAKQARFMAACAHGAGYSSCPPSKVSTEFNQADKGTGILKKAFGGKTDSILRKQPHLLPRLGGPMKLKGFSGFQRMDNGGFIDSAVPGRTDRHNVVVPSGSYVLPADHVSALGENNSLAGAKVVKDMFAPGTRFGSRLPVTRFANGGSVGEPVPVVVAGGEVILPPHIVRRIGNGDIKKGHEVLDQWVLATRKKHITKLKSLKPPKGADE